jgi:hypothetical protein
LQISQQQQKDPRTTESDVITNFATTKRFKSHSHRGGKTRPEPRNPSDPSGSKSDPIQFFKKVKLTRPDPNSTRLDPTRDQMTFNPIKIYQRFEKTQHIN